METLKELFNKSIEEIEKTSELFYQQKVSKGYEALNDTIISIAKLTEEVEKNYKDSLEFDSHKLNEILSSCVYAMEGKDVILLSDILNYELQELLIKYRDMLL